MRISIAACLVALLVMGCRSVLGLEEAATISDDEDLSDGQEERTGIDFTSPGPTKQPLSQAGAGACGPNAKVCLGQCVMASDPRFGCSPSDCGAPCALPYAKAVCKANACSVLECKSGWSDCNGDPSDGCEADTWEPANCGGCGNACPEAKPYCDHGVCSPTAPAPTQ
jgi:hypothetical protein